MNIQEAKQIKIADYLQSLGHRPVKQQGANLWYKSPLRNESEASFKVNTIMNSWFDFGMGKGGNIITLASYLYASDNLPYLLDKLEKQVPHVRPTDISFTQQATEPSFERLEVRELNHPALLRYLSERKINLHIAQKECAELHFSHGGKSYFAIGFKNKSGGYEVRNRFFKGCMSPKDITHIRQQGETRYACYVFEGMMDYLSFLSLRMEKFPACPSLDAQDYVILNSTSNVDKAIDALHGYERVSCLLDNDDAGRKATLAIETALGYRVRDASHLYSEYNDLNDYLCGVKSKQSVHQVQPVKRTVPPRKKANAVRLCADDVLNRDKMIGYHDSYAEAMSKYGLKRGVRGSDARHTTTAQYYRNIKRETERLQNCMKLLQSDVEEAQQLLQQTKSEISTEKLQAAKMEAKTALVSKIGSLLGSGKLKEVEQHNRKLCELVTDHEQYIDELHEKLQRMEDSHSQQLGDMQQKHQAEVADLKSKHATEVSLLNDIIRKAKRWLPMLDARLHMENLCHRIGFTAEQIGVLLTGKALNFSGSLYSEEHRRKFNVENAEIKVFSDSTKPNQLFLYINRQPIVEWFKEQWDNLRKFTRHGLKL